MKTLTCPGCEHGIQIPDIGARRPPGTECLCSCGDEIGVLYTKDGPVLIWWRPSKPIVVRVVNDHADAEP
jgi:hypothetical protein